MKQQPEVLCLLPRMSDARIARRVDMLRQAGYQVQALAFERDRDPGRLPTCPVESLGHILGGSYLTRLRKLLRSVSRVRCAVARNDIVYAFNADMAGLVLLARVGRAKPLVIEVADIRSVQVAAGWGRVVRGLEKLIVERCRLLVLTASEYRRYYRDRLRTDTPILVIENKVDASFADTVRAARRTAPADDSRPDGRFRIGWFGILKDEWSLRVVDALSRSAPHRIVSVLAGTPGRHVKDFSSRVTGKPGIEFRGEYRYPGDLRALYGSTDAVMACYRPQIPYGWSRSNRYYDACLFRRPLIVRGGCADADQVQRHDIGLIIDDDDCDAAAARISAVTAADWRRWSANMAALPESVYTNAGDADALHDSLRSHVMGPA